MRQEDKLKEIYGTESGYRVPENYFEQLNARIISSLPEYPETPKEVRLSAWQRIKPYVYLAAMFAGIWLMMTMFHHIASSADSFNLDNPPEAFVNLIEKEGYEASPVYHLESDYDLEQEVSGIYNTFDEFESDFGYKLSPAYASL